MSDKLMISHGRVTHSYAERLECMDCIDCEIEFLKAVKEAGGLKKLVENMRKEIDAKPEKPA